MSIIFYFGSIFDFCIGCVGTIFGVICRLISPIELSHVALLYDGRYLTLTSSGASLVCNASTPLAVAHITSEFFFLLQQTHSLD